MNDITDGIIQNLSDALARCEGAFAEGVVPEFCLSDRCRAALEQIHEKAEAASAVFTNIVTCLAIKCAKPEADVRYHQTQIQKDTSRPAGVNFRGISEDVIYPWLVRNQFNGAKSGWQTRTLERPKPYKMDYDENIAYVKTPFLIIFDEIEEQHQSSFDALSFLIYLQIQHREKLKIKLSIPKTSDINIIVEILNKHFFKSYKGSKGASRLPVLALYGIYSVMVEELKRYEGKSICKLHEHSAADSQTGSVGDIEIKDNETQQIFEAVEIKHNIEISETIAASVRAKIMDRNVSRYYILTTHNNCEPHSEAKKIIKNIFELYECQVIANGLMPSIKYYLRLLSDPGRFFTIYVDLLQTDKAIAHEHRLGWNEVTTSI